MAENSPLFARDIPRACAVDYIHRKAEVMRGPTRFRPCYALYIQGVLMGIVAQHVMREDWYVEPRHGAPERLFKGYNIRVTVVTRRTRVLVAITFRIQKRGVAEPRKGLRCVHG